MNYAPASPEYLHRQPHNIEVGEHIFKMPFVRNPFRKQDENIRPVTSGLDKTSNGTPTQPVAIKEKEPAEYKLSGELT